MSYTINLTNGNVYTTIPDGTVNTSSSMTLIGKNYAGYGQFLDDNFIHLLENGANSTPPGAPLTGQLWFNTTIGVLQVYNGSIFKSLGGATAATTGPAQNIVGDLWYDTINSQLNVWTGTAWLVVGPTYTSNTGVTGAVPTTVVDSIGTSHVIIEMYVGDTIAAIISKDASFTPSPAIQGFTTINPGMQLSSFSGSGQPLLFTGTATNSVLLNNLTSSQFIRSDISSNTTGNLSIVNNTGLFVGANSIFNTSISGVGNTDVYLKNSQPGGNINILVNVPGTGNISALNISGANGIVTGTAGIIANNSTLFNGLTSNQFMRSDVTNTTTTGNLSVTGNISTPASITVAGNVNGNLIHGNYLIINNDAEIFGNLSVTGNVTFTNSNIVTTNDLYISLANNQTTYSGINGAGLEAGPIGSPLTYFTYSQPANAWVTNVGLASSGNISAANFNGNFTGNVIGTVPSAASLSTAHFTIHEYQAKLYFSYNGTYIAVMDSTGDFYTGGDVSAYTNPLP